MSETPASSPSGGTPTVTFGELYRTLIYDLGAIRNICENSNPTFRVRVQQVLAVLDKREEWLKSGAGGTPKASPGEREEFEKWGNEKGAHVEKTWVGDHYENFLVESAWQGWQARASRSLTEPRKLSDLPRCDNCKSADVIKWDFPPFTHRCVPCDKPFAVEGEARSPSQPIKDAKDCKELPPVQHAISYLRHLVEHGYLPQMSRTEAEHLIERLLGEARSVPAPKEE